MQLDLRSVRSVDELHALLARSFAFPEWYGRNWDAVWDCLSDPQLSTLPRRLRISGLAELASRLPRDAHLLRECFEELPLERPGVVVELED